MRPYKRAISAEEREKLIVGAAAGVTGIYRYFEARRLVERHPPDNVTTFRRTAPKIGRNDPCPCGSGKKFQTVLWKNYTPLKLLQSPSPTPHCDETYQAEIPTRQNSLGPTEAMTEPYPARLGVRARSE